MAKVDLTHLPVQKMARFRRDTNKWQCAVGTCRGILGVVKNFGDDTGVTRVALVLPRCYRLRKDGVYRLRHPDEVNRKNAVTLALSTDQLPAKVMCPECHMVCDIPSLKA